MASGVADIRSVVRCLGIRTCSDQFATSGVFLSAVHVRPESQKVVRPGGSQRGSQATVWPTGSPGVDRPLFRPDVSPARHRKCECLRALPTADVCRWSLLLLSPLLSAVSRPGILFRRSMESVRPVRQNPNPQVSVLPRVRPERKSPAPSGQSVENCERPLP
jgi:hypothetical protein